MQSCLEAGGKCGVSWLRLDCRGRFGRQVGASEQRGKKLSSKNGPPNPRKAPERGSANPGWELRQARGPQGARRVRAESSAKRTCALCSVRLAPLCREWPLTIAFCCGSITILSRTARQPGRGLPLDLRPIIRRLCRRHLNHLLYFVRGPRPLADSACSSICAQSMSIELSLGWISSSQRAQREEPPIARGPRPGCPDAEFGPEVLYEVLDLSQATWRRLVLSAAAACSSALSAPCTAHRELRPTASLWFAATGSACSARPEPNCPEDLELKRVVQEAYKARRAKKS